MTDLLPDFPPGPLDLYRKRASFDWKKLKVFIDTEDVVKYERDLQEVFKNHPEFQTDLLSMSFDEERRVTQRRVLSFGDIELMSLPSLLENLKRASVLGRVLMPLTPSAFVKFSAGSGLFSGTLRSQGTKNHREVIKAMERKEVQGCYCLTEIGHGSNAKGMRTRAIYDKETQQFIMYTPDFEAAKCWAGALGQFATHALVYAQLYIDGTQHGLHQFLVPIRDPKTLIPYPGVIVGDMGEKIGLNGIDNGFLMFDNYPIPRENLLNKNSEVTPDGHYVTRFKNLRERQGGAFGTLSIGRVSVTTVSENLGTKALTIAVRYAAVRKQFGPEGEGEVPILEYQSHQHRLLPYLAGAYVLRVFSMFLVEMSYQFTVDSMMGTDKDKLAELGMEIHGVSSASKAVSSWLFRDAIQECREACGGHGYLKASGIGDIRNDNDANLTYEGENHVLIQQNSNWLLKLWPEIEKGAKISSPLKSLNFLSDALKILNHKFSAGSVEEVCKPEVIIDAYRWLVCYLLRETKIKLDALTPQLGEFWSKSDVQVFYAKSLSIAFIQHFFLQHMLEKISEATDTNIRNVLTKLFSLYGLWSLEKFLPTLYEGGYAHGPQLSRLVHDAILKLCADIKDDAVALIDAIAPPDFILNSVLGASDGQVYRRLQSAMMRSPYSMSRPKWWAEIVNFNKGNMKNKL